MTNAISFLPKVDKILVLVDGQISESGTYKELVEKVPKITVYRDIHVRTQHLMYMYM